MEGTLDSLVVELEEGKQVVEHLAGIGLVGSHSQEVAFVLVGSLEVLGQVDILKEDTEEVVIASLT